MTSSPRRAVSSWRWSRTPSDHCANQRGRSDCPPAPSVHGFSIACTGYSGLGRAGGRFPRRGGRPSREQVEFRVGRPRKARRFGMNVAPERVRGPGGPGGGREFARPGGGMPEHGEMTEIAGGHPSGGFRMAAGKREAGGGPRRHEAAKKSTAHWHLVPAGRSRPDWNSREAAPCCGSAGATGFGAWCFDGSRTGCGRHESRGIRHRGRRPAPGLPLPGARERGTPPPWTGSDGAAATAGTQGPVRRFGIGR